MLGGAPRPADRGPAPDWQANPYPGYPPAGAPRPTVDYYEPPPNSRPEAPYYPGHPSLPPAAATPTPEPPRPISAPSLDSLDDDDLGKTRFVGGVNIDKLRIPKHVNSLQIFGSNGQWYDWGPIPAKGMNVGRAKSSADFPGLSSMAVRHMKFSYSRTSLMVEDLGSLNGVFVRLTQPVELVEGMRFRVGGQRIEFLRAEPFDQVEPLVSDDGEAFCGGDLSPLAYLDLIRGNGKPGLRFPITKPGTTIIGREGAAVDLALTGDNAVSGSHAQIRHEEGKFYLEDLKSRNGTFVQILDSYVVKSGDVFLAGQVLFRVIDQSE